MDRMKDPFKELVKDVKSTGRTECTNNEWDDLCAIASKPKVLPGTDWVYYAIIILIIIIIILACITFYYNIKPNTKTIDLMNDTKNKSYGFPVEFDETEYDEDGTEVVFVDD